MRSLMLKVLALLLFSTSAFAIEEVDFCDSFAKLTMRVIDYKKQGRPKVDAYKLIADYPIFTKIGPIKTLVDDAYRYGFSGTELEVYAECIDDK